MPVLSLLILLASCAGPKRNPEPALPAAEGGSAAEADPPALVVLVVVDQLSQGHMDKLEPYFESGLGRLTGEQAFQAVAAHRHAVTETCPGHATLATGASPARHGIVGNDFYMEGKRTYCLEAGMLDTPSIGDVATAAGRKVVSLSLKDRGATLLAGKQPALAAWMDKKTGAFVTGEPRAPVPVEPPLVGPERQATLMAGTWTPLRPDLYTQLGLQDDQPFENDPGLGSIFPHGPVPPEKPALLASTPAGGTLLTEAALATVGRFELGKDDAADLLTLSYSHFDVIGHTWTPSSWEAADALLRLDQDLDALMQGLDAQVGPGRWTLLLTADHGIPPGPPIYVDLDGLKSKVDAALQAEGLPPLTGALGGEIYFDPALSPEQRAQSVPIAAAVGRSIEGVEDVVDLEAPTGPFAEAFTLNHAPGRSADLALVLVENAVPVYARTPKGTSHGSPRAYDQQVPLLAIGAGIRPGQSPLLDTRQVAPTLARLLRVDVPSGAEAGPVEALLEPVED